MLTNIFIVVAAMSAAIIFLYGVTRTSEAHARKESNDFTGAVVAVIGTTYAVLLAFMLSNVWDRFQQAEVNVEQEANDIVNVYRIGSLLPAPTGMQLQQLAPQYANNVISREFPEMLRDNPPQPDDRLVEDMWRAASKAQPHTPGESQAMGALMSTLGSLTEHRRIRILQSGEQLPPMLWIVLIAGGIITVAASCFFGVPNFRFHLLQVVVLSFLISLILVAIADIDRPYQGHHRVAPNMFQYALETIAAAQKD